MIIYGKWTCGCFLEETYPTDPRSVNVVCPGHLPQRYAFGPDVGDGLAIVVMSEDDIRIGSGIGSVMLEPSSMVILMLEPMVQ